MSLGGMIVEYYYNSGKFKGRIQDKVKTSSLVNDGMEKRRTDVEDHYVIEATDSYSVTHERFNEMKGR